MIKNYLEEFLASTAASSAQSTTPKPVTPSGTHDETVAAATTPTPPSAASQQMATTTMTATASQLPVKSSWTPTDAATTPTLSSAASRQLATTTMPITALQRPVTLSQTHIDAATSPMPSADLSRQLVMATASQRPVTSSWTHIDAATIPTPSSAASRQLAMTVSRRLVTPCWSDAETAALIDAYREKWYSLGRGHLRANHWAEVADTVHARCPNAGAKTAVQCRHKLEKLRQRYRHETQRLAAAGKPGSSSSWVFFMKMDSMELGTVPDARLPSSSSSEKVNSRVNSPKVDALKFNIPRAVRSKVANGVPCDTEKKKKRKGSFVWEMVSAVQMMGEEFSRIEEMKMTMVRDMEKMRREMETKRTRMILDSQRQLADYIRGLHDKISDEISPKV